ncbi:MAG: efflux RND transporter periplasmic adaptor subunit [Ignavibacteriota bacterium]|jgi:membrane fusion protein (multidrug efflux system)|nr:MAG: efflux RND transporter periplasmic adaptor subunit [Chlorobiota bacterium]MBE7477312.1 efflux RND transporter periplasmic adaptor subunit [Ignavibacteriales bacterium]MBL1122712.1 efflux RND transporter periplasmic adaptor subunit [Ignavibacteriota bacterium]MCC7092960.1 efflux RND transporter periplasmic adaptor subunit [Ignavibacteriaceae bacterium]MCE7856210.1 efflux RND transporter periplasmic adaptor subunit [Ignavibacteria bacterium CHB3]MEB2296483.1 efflux RND transporter peripl
MLNPKRSLSAFCLLLLSLLLIFLVFACGEEEQQTGPPPEVQITKALKMNVPVTGEWVGQTLGAVDIEIRARVEGWLTGIYFKEGSEVRQGALLYTIDATELQEAVAEAEGKVAAVRTLLIQAEDDVKRYTPLAKAGAVSQRDLEIAVSKYEAQQGELDAALAALNIAKTNLSYATIYAPITGLIGISVARVGDFVGRPPNVLILNTISRVDSVHVRFSISEQEYLDLIRRIEQNEGRTKVKAKEIQMVLADETVYPYLGVISFAQRQIDPATGTLQFEASFPNPKRTLRPGQFAKIRIVIDERKDATVVPSRSIFEIQGQKSVYIVDENKKVVMRVVTTGPEYNNYIVIESGVNPGENVIYEGLLKVRPDMVVSPIEAKIPDSQEKPSKEN